MGEIYKKSSGVLAWLRTGDQGKNSVVMMLKELASSAPRCGIREVTDGIVYFPGRKQSSEDEERALQDLAAATDFAKLKPLYEKPWFSRIGSLKKWLSHPRQSSSVARTSSTPEILLWQPL
jgi:hypothetical protein